MPKVLKPGLSPDEKVATELGLECSPAELVESFVEEMMMVYWMLETLESMSTADDMPMTPIFSLAGDLLSTMSGDVMKMMAEDGKGTVTEIEQRAFLRFSDKLNQYTFSERDIKAGETYASQVVRGHSPLAA